MKLIPAYLTTDVTYTTYSKHKNENLNSFQMLQKGIKITFGVQININLTEKYTLLNTFHHLGSVNFCFDT